LPARWHLRSSIVDDVWWHWYRLGSADERTTPTATIGQAATLTSTELNTQCRPVASDTPASRTALYCGSDSNAAHRGMRMVRETIRMAAR
jgi:hypothetical protein